MTARYLDTSHGPLTAEQVAAAVNAQQWTFDDLSLLSTVNALLAPAIPASVLAKRFCADCGASERDMMLEGYRRVCGCRQRAEADAEERASRLSFGELYAQRTHPR